MFHHLPIPLDEFKARPCDDPFQKKMAAGIKGDNCESLLLGYFNKDEELVGACATKEYRNVANMKWIMTFARGQGVFRAMMEDSVFYAYDNGRDYYRVSINPPALPAYQALGFKVWGEQKSGCFLSIGRLQGPHIQDIDWSMDDYIRREVYKKTMGGCVNAIYDVPR